MFALCVTSSKILQCNGLDRDAQTRGLSACQDFRRQHVRSIEYSKQHMRIVNVGDDLRTRYAPVADMRALSKLAGVNVSVSVRAHSPSLYGGAGQK
jgi:hypothetical protein